MADPDLAERLRHPDGSARLAAALDAGSSVDPDAVDALVARCAVEPDLLVRETLTWALVRQPAERTVPRLVAELSSPFPHARSQALRTLTKIGDPTAGGAIGGALLHDEEDEVARAAWRAAVVLRGGRGDGDDALAAELCAELGRRDHESRQSLARALVGLGEPARAPLEHVVATGAFAVRVHALATLRLLDDPGAGFTRAVEEAEHRVLGAGTGD